MNDVTTAVARVIAMEAGARFCLTEGVYYDMADTELAVMAEALLRQAEGTGIDFVALRRDGKTLWATVDDENADEPLSPSAFGRVVQRLSFQVLGEVWEGRLTSPPIEVPAADLIKVA